MRKVTTATRAKPQRGGNRQLICGLSKHGAPCTVTKVLGIIQELTSNSEEYKQSKTALKDYVVSRYTIDGRINYASWHIDPYSIRAARSLLFAAQFERVEIKSALKQNSANCKFTIAVGKMENGSDVPLFVKVVPYPTPKNTDSILVDNINGKIFNMFMQRIPDMSGSFMIYVDSFLNWTSKDQWNFDITSNVDNLGSPLFLPNRTLLPTKESGILANFPECQISISCAVKGRSLMNVLEEAINKPEAQKPSIDKCRKIMLAFPRLYEHIKLLGREWGMLHNDLHLGNLMYDDNTRKIVCIDYGRVHFQRLADEKVQMINEFVKIEVDKMGVPTTLAKTLVDYKTVMDAFHKHTKSEKIGIEYPMHIMDLMTLAGNMYLFFLATETEATKKAVKDCIDPFLNFSVNDANSFLTRNITITTLRNMDDVKANYNKFLTAINTKRADIWYPFFKGIGEGLYYIAMLVSATPNATIQLTSNPLFWHHFQYIGRPDDVKNIMTSAMKPVENLTDLRQSPSATQQMSSMSSSPMDIDYTPPTGIFPMSVEDRIGGKKRRQQRSSRAHIHKQSGGVHTESFFSQDKIQCPINLKRPSICTQTELTALLTDFDANLQTYDSDTHTAKPAENPNESTEEARLEFDESDKAYLIQLKTQLEQEGSAKEIKQLNTVEMKAGGKKPKTKKITKKPTRKPTK